MNYDFTITNPFHCRSSKRIIFIRWFDSESSVQSWSCIRHIFFLYSNGFLFKISVNFTTLEFLQGYFLTLLRFHEIFQDNFMKLTVFLQVTTCAGQFVCLCFEKIIALSTVRALY